MQRLSRKKLEKLPYTGGLGRKAQGGFWRNLALIPAIIVEGTMVQFCQSRPVRAYKPDPCTAQCKIEAQSAALEDEQE